MKATMKRVWTTIRTWSKRILVLMAPASLGAVAGLLTGQSGPDSTVLAAVLSAVITGGGWGLFAYHFRRGGEAGDRQRVLASGMVVLFTVFLFFGAYVGIYWKEVKAIQDYNLAYDLANQAQPP